MLIRSQFNFFIHRREGLLGYNARTGTFALLSPEAAEMLQGSEPVGFGQGPDELVEMGFLHRGDELKSLAEKFAGGRSSRETGLALTIAPTIACNLRCSYCFQSDYRANAKMSPETQAATADYVAALVAAGRRNVALTWYGGEPLLVKEIVLEMTERLKSRIADSGGTLRSLSIITNATLLTRETARSLSETGLESAQISFDALYHDGPATRGVLNRDGKPSRILSNALAARDFLKIRIRINCTGGNRDEIPRITAVLDEHGFGDACYLARVYECDYSDSGCRQCGSQSERQTAADRPSPEPRDRARPLTRSDFAALDRRLTHSETNRKSLQKMIRSLKPANHYCGATSGSLFVIDPAGDISRCWNSAGVPGEAVGNVHEEVRGSASSETEAARRWAAYSPFRYRDCENCKVLPLCMGGCPHDRAMADAAEPPCPAIRFQVREAVETVGGHLELGEEQIAAVSDRTPAAV